MRRTTSLFARLVILLATASTALPAREAPRLLLTPEDFARIERVAQSLPWAAAARDSILQTAQNWPAAHNQRYGLTEWQLPPEGGQWTLWYVCPVHGVSLQFRGPGQNVCPVDNRNFTGWPYDQVIYARRHSESANAARDLALAYRLTGNRQFARDSARILLAYADAYGTYPIKDVNNRANATSGGRVTAQTLDESVWLIPIAWAYDLIAESGELESAARARIEQSVLRAAAAVISRNDARESNWQSWHNAALAAVGFTLEDAALIDKTVNGPSGFRFQMRQSVFSDGLWYEGAWGYHFFALEPLVMQGEMAARNGIDLFAEPSLRAMFDAPLRYAMPDWTLPPFNDSGNTSILGYDRLYESAYARYAEPLFATILGRRSRGREALFWGAETLPQAAAPAPSSTLFPSGNAVLRAGEQYLAMKFGPHGGWHGHYDKLGFVTWARGGIMAVDPGTQSYAAPTHDTWDKVTLAHNTVVVDETTQAEAAGQLRAFAALPSVSAVRASAGAAYRQAELTRTMLLTPEYALDVFDARSTDGAEHQFDWLYHNYGEASTALPLETYAAFPARNGYQHLRNTRAAPTANDWQVSFDMNADLQGSYGSVFASGTGASGTFRYSREQAATGLFAGRVGYEFTANTGYIVASTPQLERQPAEVPLRVSLMIYGDGSGHRLALRIYDSTDERFVYTVGPVNWTGWRLITASDPARWTHYLGNDNGLIDTPIKTVSVELTYASPGPQRGALFVDDITLDYPSAPALKAADFERDLRGLRLWMLAAPATTVATGDGLGPDLLKPVPFAMARRRGTSAQFVALLEPFGETPAVTAFQRLPDGTLHVRSSEFSDRISLDDSGVLRFTRRAAGRLARIGLSGGLTLDEDGRTLMRTAATVPVQVDFSAAGDTAAVQVSGAVSGELRLLAPDARQVTLNSAAVAFTRDGDYIVLNAGRPPAIAALVNAATFAAPVAPGALVSIFGSGLSLATATATQLPLPATLGGTSATLNGATLPLLYVSPGQINAQIPFTAATGAATLAINTPAGSSSATIQIGAVAPAVFAAVPGSVVVIYATGLGPVAPAVPAGAAAPSQPLARCMLPITVSIGGREAAVTYAGLAPGWSGLYQVNAILPEGMAAGAPVIVHAGGMASNPFPMR